MSNYYDTKAAFIQKEMNTGKTNKQARKLWSNSKYNKDFEIDNHRGNIDRSYESPMQDWAQTSDDL